MATERKSDPPGLRTVFRVNAPRFDELENAEDEDYGSWGAFLLKEALAPSEFTDAATYGREAVITIEGVSYTVSLGFQGPAWLGFVNAAAPLLDTTDVRRALVAIDRRLRETDGVLEVKWMDRAAFTANREAWEDAPVG